MKYILAVCVVILLSGCNTTVNEERIKGIVDACYVNRDNEEKVMTYLEKKKRSGEISEEGVIIIREYTRRSNAK